MNILGCDRTFYNNSTAEWTISIIMDPYKPPAPNGGTNPCKIDKKCPIDPKNPNATVQCTKCILPGIQKGASPTTATVTYYGGSGSIRLETTSYTVTYGYRIQSSGFSKRCPYIDHDGKTLYMDVNKPANGDITINNNPNSTP